MSERQTAPRFSCENGDPADAALMARLQQAASLSNENCDRATALACTLWAELRDAQRRINELEREADERLQQTKREAEERIVRAEADTDERLARVGPEIEAAFTRLEVELAEAR